MCVCVCTAVYHYGYMVEFLLYPCLCGRRCLREGRYNLASKEFKAEEAQQEIFQALKYLLLCSRCSYTGINIRISIIQGGWMNIPSTPPE